MCLNVILCRAEKQVNGLESHTDSETDKTVSDDEDAGKASAKHSKKTAANKSNDSDDSDDDDDDDDDDDVVAVTEPRPAKVIAGEVIKQWQTKTRSKGNSDTAFVYVFLESYFKFVLKCFFRNFKCFRIVWVKCTYVD